MTSHATHWVRRGMLPLLLALPVAAFALTPSQVFDKVKDSVLVVRALDAQGKPVSQGSGVMLPSGKVATNCHVLKNGTRFLVGSDKQFVPAILHAEDADKDLCLLNATGLAVKAATLGRASGLKVGDAVYSVSSPIGLELSLSDGIVSQLRGGPPPFIQTTAAISLGSSGGGLFDSEGRLVGITTFYLEGGQSLNFALPVEWLAEIKPGTKKAERERPQGDWFFQAWVLEQKKDWRGLLDWCRQWILADSGNALAWAGAGEAYIHLERYADAIEALRHALRIQPDDAEAWYSLGTAYHRLGRHADAIEAYRQARRIRSDYADAWYGLGTAYGDLNRHIDAIEALRQALRIQPDHADAWYNLGVKYGDLGQHADAIKAYRQTLRIRPDQTDAWINLGFAHGKLGQHAEAIKAYRQAIRIRPDDADAWVNLAIAYELSGNRPAALTAVQELRRYDPARADELFDLLV